MRPLLLTVLLLAGCSRFFDPPCTKLAKAICDVGPEGDACAFVLAASRDDERLQQVCASVLPAGRAYAENRADPAAQAGWQAARRELVAVGLVADDRKGRIGEKLKAAGGSAGRLVEKAENLYEEGEARTTEQAERILDEVNH